MLIQAPTKAPINVITNIVAMLLTANEISNIERKGVARPRGSPPGALVRMGKSRDRPPQCVMLLMFIRKLKNLGELQRLLLLTSVVFLPYNFNLRYGGALVSTEIMRLRLHVEVPPPSLNRWN